MLFFKKKKKGKGGGAAFVEQRQELFAQVERGSLFFLKYKRALMI